MYALKGKRIWVAGHNGMVGDTCTAKEKLGRRTEIRLEGLVMRFVHAALENAQ